MLRILVSMAAAFSSLLTFITTAITSHRSLYTSSPGVLRSGAYFNGAYYAGGDTSVSYPNYQTIYKSTDLSTWSLVIVYPTGAGTIQAMDAVGSYLILSGASGAIYVSTDGGSFTRVLITSFLLYQSAYSPTNGRYVAVGAGGKCFYSTDPLTTWTASTSFSTAVGSTLMYGVVWHIDKFVACGQSGKVAPSSDGITWTLQAAVLGTSTLRTIASNGTLMVITATGGANVTTSPDGITWTTQSSYSTALGAGSFNSYVRWNGTAFMTVAYLSSGTVRTAISTNGTAWALTTAQPTTVNTNPIMAASIGNAGVTLVLGSFGNVFRSSDSGATWVRMVPLADLYLRSYGANTVSYCNSVVFVSGGGGVIYKSSDLINWVKCTTPGSSYDITNVLYGNRYIALTYGACFTSADGITWTTATSGFFGGYVFCSVWTGTQFVVVTNAGETNLSSDGVNWTNNTTLSTAIPGVAPIACAYSGSVLVVATTTQIITSSTFTTWYLNASYAALAISARTSLAVAYGEGAFIMAADGGVCVISLDNGSTWQQTASLGLVYTAQVNSLTYIPVVGFILCGASGKIIRSADKGATWSVIPYTTVNTTPNYNWKSAVAIGPNKFLLGSAEGNLLTVDY
jgi:hypothetical protein